MMTQSSQRPMGGSTNVYIGNPGSNGFDSKTIRSDFVSKVYSILSVQLIFTSILIAVFTLHEPTKQYFRDRESLIWLYISLGVAMVVYLVLVCIQSARRSWPINMTLLGILTVAFAICAAIMSAYHDTEVVLLAIITTACSVVTITLLAKFGPFDLTTCGCGLCILGLIHLMLSIGLIIAAALGAIKMDVVNLIIASLGALLVSLYLLYDTQLIMGGRSAELSPEEYVLGAVMLYVDIVYLFQYFLIIFGGGR